TPANPLVGMSMIFMIIFNTIVVIDVYILISGLLLPAKSCDKSLSTYIITIPGIKIFNGNDASAYSFPNNNQIKKSQSNTKTIEPTMEMTNTFLVNIVVKKSFSSSLSMDEILGNNTLDTD